MVCCLCVFASVTSELIPSHGSLAFRVSTAQKTNGEYIVRAFGLTPRARNRLAVRDPDGSSMHNVRLLTEGDDTRGCSSTICPSEDEQCAARNMLRIVV